MSVTLNRHRRRGKEILLLLARLGPLSMDVLLRLMVPLAKKKNVYESLAILSSKGLIERLRPGLAKTFYAIPQDPPTRTRVAAILECSPEELVQARLRRQDLIHNELCECWIELLVRQFPTANAIREREIPQDPLANEVLLLSADKPNSELLPDFILTFGNKSDVDFLSIAFEIERTRKSNKRILQKLRTYSEKTRVDGLVYVCDSGRLSDTICMLYQESLSAKSFRIRHYSDHFFVFSDALNACDSILDRFHNANGENVSIGDWLTKLKTTKPTLRRDADFRKPELSPA